jgi:capsular exopolysaccharide synthesis family protein
MSKIFGWWRKRRDDAADAARRTPTIPLGFRTDPLHETIPEPAQETLEVEEAFPAHIRTLSMQIEDSAPIFPFKDDQRRASEQYRMLRTKISQHFKQPRLIVISSSESGDGKSVTAINTAGVLALKSGERVLLLDGDLRKSAIHSRLGLPEFPGLADVLAGVATLQAALVQTLELPNLYVLSAGSPAENPAELLDSPRWTALSTRLKSLFRYVIIDSTPVGAVADYELIQSVCDGVVLVARPDFTNRQLFQSAIDFIPKGKFLGIVLNCVPDWSAGSKKVPNYYYFSGAKVYAGNRTPQSPEPEP